jgi:deoxyribodipyrimidine photo-lyase
MNLRDNIVLRDLILPRGQEWPKHLGSLPPLRIPSLRDLNLEASEKRHAQKGGRVQAEKCLDSFFGHRSRNYSASISSPTRSASGCSRLSPYLTWGNLSISEVLMKLESKKEALGASSDDLWWKRNLESFESRLAWHCHFIQKFESEPEIEFQNMNRSFDGMRETEFNEEYFEAWCKGETGFPMIDASMRSLKINGWINFRMRAALLSFASYQLWLHWRKPAQFLAKHFVDFEPGIHFSQAQMQSGVTGINTIRIYSPKKQAVEQDPSGEFIKKYCPELSSLSPGDLPEPHLTPPLLAVSLGFEPGITYPNPIVDPDQSYSTAKQKIFDWMKRPAVRRDAKQVYEKHGSRSRTR